MSSNGLPPGHKELELQGRELEENRYASDQKRRQLQEKVKERWNAQFFSFRKNGVVNWELWQNQK